MRTVATISRKGGAGKTSIAVHLAACAEGRSMRAGIVDFDPQATSTKWVHAVPGVRRSPGPTSYPPRRSACPSIADIEAIPASADIACLAGKPFAVVLNAAVAHGMRADKACSELERLGLVVAPVEIGHRVAFGDAMIPGQGVTEYQPGSAAAKEIEGLFDWTLRHLSGEATKARPRRSKGPPEGRCMSRAAGPERKGPAAGRPSLFKSVASARTNEPSTTSAADGEEPSISTPRKRGAVRGRQDRSDKRQIAGFFSPECAKQLRVLAAEQDTTVQELIRDGLNLVFQKHGKPPIA